MYPPGDVEVLSDGVLMYPPGDVEVLSDGVLMYPQVMLKYSLMVY